MKRKNLNFNGKALIVCPSNMGNYRVYRYMYYCRYAWKFNEVTISDKIEKDNSKILIIDRNSVNNIKVSNYLKRYKIYICLWNGIFDQKEKK